EAPGALEAAAQPERENPSSFEHIVALGIAGKSYRAGDRRVDEFLRKQPNSAAGYYVRGKLYVAEEKFDLAQTALLKAIDLDSNLISAYDLLTPTCLRANKLPEALNQMNAVLAKQPNNLRALLMT